MTVTEQVRIVTANEGGSSEVPLADGSGGYAWGPQGGTGGVAGWQANTSYTAGQQVSHNSQLYAAVTAFTSGSSFNSANWLLLGGTLAGVALLGSSNTFTARQNFTAPLTVGATTLYSGDTQLQVNYTMTNPDVVSRAVATEWSVLVAPAAAPSSLTDFHALDIRQSIQTATHINTNVRLYGCESTVTLAAAASMNQLVAMYGFPNVSNGGTVTTGAWSYRSNVSVTGASTVGTYVGFHQDSPVTEAGSTISAYYGIFIQNPLIGPSVGLLSGPLSTGSPITSIPLASALTANVTAGNVTITSGYQSQTFATVGALAGATSIPVTSTTPNYAYPDASSVAQQPGTVSAAYGIYSAAPVWVNNNLASSQPALTVAQWSSAQGISVTVNSTSTSASGYALAVTQSAGVAAQAVVITQNTAAQALTVIQTQAAVGVQITQQSSGDALYLNGGGAGNTGIGLHVNQGANAGNAVVIAQAAATAAIVIAQNGNGNAITVTSGSSSTPVTGTPLQIAHFPNAAGSFGIQLTVSLGTGGTAAQALVITQNCNANAVSITQAGNSGGIVLTKSGTSTGTAMKVVNQGIGDTLQLLTGATPTIAVKVTSLGSLVIGPGAALATNATDGFPYLPSCAGTPTGTPTTQTGTVPAVIDTTNSKLWAYIGGAWKGVVLA